MVGGGRRAGGVRGAPRRSISPASPPATSSRAATFATRTCAPRSRRPRRAWRCPRTTSSARSTSRGDSAARPARRDRVGTQPRSAGHSAQPETTDCGVQPVGTHRGDSSQSRVPGRLSRGPDPLDRWQRDPVFRGHLLAPAVRARSVDKLTSAVCNRRPMIQIPRVSCPASRRGATRLPRPRSLARRRL
jgi:hypothetical protein